MRTALVVVAIILVAVAVQLVLIRWAFTPEIGHLQTLGIDTGPTSPLAKRLRPRVIVALLAPLLIAGIGSGVLVGIQARRRSRDLVDALQRVAGGDFGATLPAARDPEWQIVADAFAAMSRELRDAMGRLGRADAQRRRLFADLAHELATPTTAILSLIDALEPQGRPIDPQRSERLLAALDRESSRLGRLIGDLRELASLDDPDVSIDAGPGDVGSIARRVVGRFLAVQGASAAITLDASAAWASVDDARVDQVLTNLLTNARRHTPTGGEIRVVVRGDAASVRLVVDDNGPGVPGPMLARLGERLLRLDPSRSRDTGGNGMGLSIVAAIVERHGGTIEFASSDLGGLRVEVQLPRVPAP